MEIRPHAMDPNLPIGQPRDDADPSRKKADPEALRRTCQQFEAIFIRQLFKGMRATVPEAGLMAKDDGVEIFQDLMDDQVSKQMSGRQRLGIAEALFRQLENRRK